MTCFCITQATADWILGKPAVLKSIHDMLLLDAFNWNQLVDAEFVEGPIRIAFSPQLRQIAMWHVDYLSGTGTEPWGFISLDKNTGLTSGPISTEVLERSLYVINQRLQGLFIDGAFIHRPWPNGTHTCLAGRGSTARQVSIGYYEDNSDPASGYRSIICVGPEHDFGVLSTVAAEAGKSIPKLVENANELVIGNRRHSVAKAELLTQLRSTLIPYTRVECDEATREFDEVELLAATTSIPIARSNQASGLTYQQWLQPGSPLSDSQRRILFSDAIDRHPLRIVGPGGSGKTLLMQLLALRRIELARMNGKFVRVLYVVHNASMATSVASRFEVLDGPGELLRDDARKIEIWTLTEYGRQQLGLDYGSVIDPDAYEAKQFQLEQVTAALRQVIEDETALVADSRLFSEIARRQELFPALALLTMMEISTAIKGHGLVGDPRRYIESEKQLSRFHGILSSGERNLIYNVYERYNASVFEQFEVLDTDDIALSLLGRLRTPIWELKRKKLGYDYVFVDETQLFNENERRVLPWLTTGSSNHVPIILALDEAQNIFAQATAGMSTLGIPNIANESLSSIHRSTRSIIRLAFFVIQRSTDLFGSDFPDFTGLAEQMEADNHPLAAPPRIDVGSADSKLGKFVVKRIRELRRSNIRQIAVICHSDQYWKMLSDELTSTDLPLHVLLQRGEKILADQPIVVLTQPAFVGGQEFDAVILVGLEQGVVPPRIINNDALAVAVEQQALREIYLSVTRARYRVIVVLSYGSSATAILQDAETAEVISRVR